MWTTDCTFNLIDVANAYFVVAADANDAVVQPVYLGSKAGGVASQPFTNLAPVAVPAFKTAMVPIDLANAAFNGGYGAVQLVAQPAGVTGVVQPFLAHAVIRSPLDLDPVSGPAFVGTSFRVPVVASRVAQQIKIVVTVVQPTAPGSPSPIVTIGDPGGAWSAQQAVDFQASWLWDSAAQPPINVQGAGEIAILSPNALVVVSFFARRGLETFHGYLPPTSLPRLGGGGLP